MSATLSTSGDFSMRKNIPDRDSATELAALAIGLIRKIVREEVEAATPTEFLSTGEAAELARVAPGTIRRGIREHRLEQHRVGREVRVKRAAVEALLRRDAKPANIAEFTPEEQARRDFGGV